MWKQFSGTRHVSLLACLAVVICLPATARADKLLRWKFQKGDQRTVSITQDTNIAMTKEERTTDVKIRQALVIRQLVEDVDDQGNATISHQFAGIRVSVEGAKQISFTYDSANPQESKGVDEIAPLLKSLMKSTYTTRMSPQGRILEVQLPDEFTALPESSPALQQGLFTFFSKEGFAQLMKDSAAVFAEQPVEENDQWTDKVEVHSAAGNQVMVTTYIYQGEEDQGGRTLDRIDLNVVIEFPPQANNDNAAKITAKEQNTTGAIWFDAEAGQLVRGSVTQKLIMEADSPEGVIRSNISGKVEVEVTSSQR